MPQLAVFRLGLQFIPPDRFGPDEGPKASFDKKELPCLERCSVFNNENFIIILIFHS